MRNEIPPFTEASIIDGWERWGDGKPLKPGFAKWLADELNKPSCTLPVHGNHDADLVNRTIGFQVRMRWSV